MSVLVNEDMEPEGVMSNYEYHECMSEVYLTRTMMFAIVTAFMYKDYGLCLAFACTMFVTIACAIRTISHMRRANG